MFELIAISVSIVLVVVFTTMFLASCYKRCPSNQILVVYGKVGGDGTAKCIHGGGTFVWPLIQSYTYMSMIPFNLNPKLDNGISRGNIVTRVDTNFTVAISTDKTVVANASERLLGLQQSQIASLANEAIVGQLRQIVSTMTIDELNTDRDTFAKKANEFVETELNKLGLTAINVNINSINDAAGVLDAKGKRAAEEAKQDAVVAVAEQLKKGELGKAQADQERETGVADFNSKKEQGKQKALFEQQAEVERSRSASLKIQNESKALTAQYNAELQIAEAKSLEEGQVAKLAAEVKVQEKQKDLEKARLETSEIARQEVELKKIKLQAEAEAEAIRIVAKAEAEKTEMQAKAKANGEKAMLEAKASGYKSMLESMGKQAPALLMIEKVEELGKIQAEAISKIRIDKLSIIDSGSGNTISNLSQDLVKSFPKMKAIADGMGFELPEFLGKFEKELPETTSKQ